MPTDNVAKTLVRVLEMLRCLPRSGSGMEAKDIQAALHEKGFEVKRRTVERDLKTLQEAFSAYIKCNDKSRPYGWRWREGAHFEVVSMSVTEALSLQAINEAIKPLLPASVLASLEPRFKQARTMLAEQAGKNIHANWAKKVRSVEPGMPMQPPHIDAGVLNALQEALLHNEYVKLHYQKAGDTEFSERFLQPLALVQRGPVTYLVAIKDDEDIIKLYAVHRITAAERSYLPANKCADFDIDEYIAEGHLHFGDSQATGKEVKFKASVNEWLMHILKESPLSADQKLYLKGELWWVEATVRDTRQLQWWVLSQGPAIEVHAPKALRTRIGEKLTAAAQCYASSAI